jgi:hypothetical protein
MAMQQSLRVQADCRVRFFLRDVGVREAVECKMMPGVSADIQIQTDVDMMALALMAESFEMCRAHTGHVRDRRQDPYRLMTLAPDGLGVSPVAQSLAVWVNGVMSLCLAVPDEETRDALVRQGWAGLYLGNPPPEGEEVSVAQMPSGSIWAAVYRIEIRDTPHPHLPYPASRAMPS